MQEGNLSSILRALCDYKVEFILVGGLAAVLQGAPIQTYDVDVVYSIAPSNLDRLLSFFESVDAIFRIQPTKRLIPNVSHLGAAGHLNLLTRFGPLDLLGTIGRQLKFEDLLLHCTEMQLFVGQSIRILDLETIIAIKEQVAWEKDLAVLPVLRRTLQAIRQRENVETANPGGNES
jgi:hypothetical protein